MKVLMSSDGYTTLWQHFLFILGELSFLFWTGAVSVLHGFSHE